MGEDSKLWRASWQSSADGVENGDAAEDAAAEEDEAVAARMVDMNCDEARLRMKRAIRSKRSDKATVRWAEIRWNDCYCCCF